MFIITLMNLIVDNLEWNDELFFTKRFGFIYIKIEQIIKLLQSYKVNGTLFYRRVVQSTNYDYF